MYVSLTTFSAGISMYPQSMSKLLRDSQGPFKNLATCCFLENRWGVHQKCSWINKANGDEIACEWLSQRDWCFFCVILRLAGVSATSLAEAVW